MRRIINYICMIFSILIVLSCFGQQNGFPVLKGPYLGQDPPGDRSKLFLPGLISTYDIEGCIAFLDNGRVCVFSNRLNGVFYMYEKGGRWTEPQEALFQNENKYTDYSAGPDGKTLYFQSRRPITPDDTLRDANIWAVEWIESGWGEPYPLPHPANTDEYSEAYPAVTTDGSVYFFNSSRPGAQMGDIYRSRFINGGYTDYERLPYPLNTGYHELDPVIDSDESFIIFGSGRPGGYSMCDLYIAFKKKDGSWTHVFNMGPVINPLCDAARMSMTPDGKYFFFQSKQSHDTSKGDKIESISVDWWGDFDVYWMSTEFIYKLRDKYIDKKCAAEVIKDAYMETGLNTAVGTLRKLYVNDRNSFYFEVSELINICSDMIKSGKSDDADHLYNVLLATLPEQQRIMQGYAVTCMLNNQREKGIAMLKELWQHYTSKKNEQELEDIMSFQISSQSGMDGLLDLLDFVVQEFPDSPYAYYCLANALERAGEKAEALKQCSKSLVLKPDFTDARVLLEKLKK